MGTKREGLWDCPSCGTIGVLGRYKACPNCKKSRGEVRFYLPSDAKPVNDAYLLSLANAGPDWICSFCTTNNRGDSSHCEGCGAEKGSSKSDHVITYATANIPRTGDEAEEVEDDLKGEDASPVNLGSLMSAQDDGTRPSHYYVPIREEVWEPEKPKNDGRKQKRKNDDVYSPVSSAFQPTFNLSWIRNALIGGVVLAVIGFVLWAIFHTTNVETTVSRFTWDRTIFVDEYRTVREGAWSIPPGGRYVSDEQRIHHYNKVLDHYEDETEEYACGSETYVCGSRDDGNGFFEDVECTRTEYCERTVSKPVYRDDPVYATWYHYDIDRWVYARNVPTNGTTRDDPAPAWGNLVLECANQVQLGCERENRREEHYYVFFKDQEGKEYQRQEEMTDWLAYEIGKSYVLVINSLGIQNDPLRPDEKK